jgi:D-beta-D-heptose 7-phosphate kinase/D-beta-D-heptose 1-phosphate adenosyltransferase
VTESGFDSAAVALLDLLPGKVVLVLGDLMLDRYWWGSVSRLSPEAPVPVVHKHRATVMPGGAANVAANVASLGGRPVLVGVVGSDEAGRELRAELARRGIGDEHVLTDAGRPTTVKTRVVAHSQHVVRVDEEDRSPLPPVVSAQLADRVAGLLAGAAAVVVSDYAKGVLGSDLLRRVIRDARQRDRWVVVDPKGNDYTRYRGASLICPNRGEALAAAGLDPEAPDAVRLAGARLLDAGVADAVLVTLGEAGMMLFEPGRPASVIPALARAVYDVTGAGDTVIAVVALALAAGAPLGTAIRLANVAAGLAVEQVGTAAVTSTQLREILLARRRRETPVAPAS